MTSKKKGNVDTDIVFTIMNKIYKKESFNGVVLISGDGDYYKLVKFLLEENKLEKVLFPNKKFASSLYKEITNKYYNNLDSKEIKNKIAVKKKRGSLGN